jgi:hypothetical protein
MRIKRIAPALLLAVALVFGGGASRCDKARQAIDKIAQAKITRTIVAVSGIAGVVLSVLPDSVRNQPILAKLSIFNSALAAFSRTGEVAAWERVQGAWDEAKTLLSAEKQSRFDGLISAVTKLMNGITLPVGVAGSGGGADTTSNTVVFNLQEEDVKRLEELVR